MKKLNVGILGPGTVGGGAYEILTKNKDVIEKRTGVSVEVFKLLTRRPRPEFPAELLTDDPDDIPNNPDVNVVVETMGGIQPATSFMLQAMKNGKHVVTANKAAVAANYEELTGAALENEVKFLFEASVGGGIPVLTAIQNALSGNNKMKKPMGTRRRSETMGFFARFVPKLDGTYSGIFFIHNNIKMHTKPPKQQNDKLYNK